MKTIFTGLCALLTLAPTARAQDLTTQYAAAHLAFLNTTVLNNPLAQRQLIGQTLLDLQGNWFPASLVQMGDPQLDRETVQTVCGAVVFVLTAPAPHQFLMTRTDRRGNSLTRHFDYLVSNTFQLHVDDVEYTQYMGITNRDELIAQILQNTAGRFGTYALYHPSPSILVLQPANGAPDIYVRCPDAL